MPTPVRVVPLVTEIGTAAGHRLVALSLEVYDEFADLRFARIDAGANRPLPRRVPAPDAWRLVDDAGTAYTVVDCVGRGDRAFSNGEVRLTPAPGPEVASLTVHVVLAPDADPLSATLSL